MPSQCFPAERRLRRRAEFQRVFDGGRRVHGRYLTIIAAPNERGADRLGIVASKKLGGAVVRNRAKRLIREAFRRSEHSGRPGIDIVVIPRPNLVDAGSTSLTRDFEATVRRSRGPRS